MCNKNEYCINGANLDLGKCPKRRCWFGHLNHIIAAEELANWLSQPNVLGHPIKKIGNTYTKGGKPYKLGQGAGSSNSAISWVSYATGIVFFKDFYPPDRVNHPEIITGDHIDVWNGQIMSGQFYKAPEFDYDSAAYMADKLRYFNRSPQVWFWEL